MDFLFGKHLKILFSHLIFELRVRCLEFKKYKSFITLMSILVSMAFDIRLTHGLTFGQTRMHAHEVYAYVCIRPNVSLYMSHVRH